MIALILSSSALLALFDSYLSQYYYPQPITDLVFTLLFAFFAYLIAHTAALSIPIVLSRLFLRKRNHLITIIISAPFLFGLFVLLFVPDLYEIGISDWKYFAAAFAGTVLLLGFYSYLHHPHRNNKLVITSILAALAVYSAAVFMLNPSNTLFPSKYGPYKQDASTGSRPNFIFIVLDAMRGDGINIIDGGNNIKTPNLDNFLSQGTVFTRAYSNAPITQMSMPSLFSSRYPSDLKIGKSYLTYIIPRQYRTITEDLTSNGYDTVAIVGNMTLNEHTGITRGFDYYYLFNNYTYNNRYLPTLPILGNLLQKNSLDLVSNVIRKIAGFLNINPFNFTSDFAIDLAGQYLDVPHKRPYFLYLHLMDPHDPYTPPDYRSDYSGPLAKDFFAPHHYRPLETELFIGDYTPTEADKKHIKDLYNAEIEYLDTLIGPLLDKVRKMDNTVLVIASDHGEAFWEHGIYYHNFNIYTEMLHVPLAFYGPGVPKGKKISTPVTNINIFPTVRDLLNLPPGEGDEGQSLTGLFSGEDKTIRPNFVEFFDRFRGVIFDNYYLVKNYITDDIKDISLTDLANDPRQNVDIKDKYPEVVAKGMELIAEFEKTHLPKKNRPYNKKAVKELNKSLKSLGYVK